MLVEYASACYHCLTITVSSQCQYVLFMLQALCSTILHGPVKCIENSLSPLALRAFDQAPTVRVVLLESVAKLLREYVDRYAKNGVSVEMFGLCCME